MVDDAQLHGATHRWRKAQTAGRQKARALIVAQIEFAPEVAHDIDRILEHLIQHEVIDKAARIEGIIRAIDVLASNPLIGRPLPDGKRELVIGRRSRGYIALYRHVSEIDVVFVLALRSQSEAGYQD